MRFSVYPLLILISLFLFACNTSGVQTEEHAVKKEPMPVSIPDTVISLYIGDLPPGTYKSGNIYKDAFQWQDKNGTNVLVISTTTTDTEHRIIGESENSGDLYLKHFILNGTQRAPVLWEYHDSLARCLFDLGFDVISSDITDLDKDGIKESFVIYKLGCQNDASPLRLKLIVHEGKDLYLLEGSTIFKMRSVPKEVFDTNREIDLTKIPAEELQSDPYRSWGCYQNADDFKNAPPEFLNHAKEFWRAHSVEGN